MKESLFPVFFVHRIYVANVEYQFRFPFRNVSKVRVATLDANQHTFQHSTYIRHIVPIPPSCWLWYRVHLFTLSWQGEMSSHQEACWQCFLVISICFLLLLLLRLFLRIFIYSSSFRFLRIVVSVSNKQIIIFHIVRIMHRPIQQSGYIYISKWINILMNWTLTHVSHAIQQWNSISSHGIFNRFLFLSESGRD